VCFIGSTFWLGVNAGRIAPSYVITGGELATREKKKSFATRPTVEAWWWLTTRFGLGSI
jgi:hypothetical protein